MKMLFKALSLLLAILMCTGVFAACSEPELSGSTPNENSSANSATSADVSEGNGLNYGPADYGTFPYENQTLSGDPIRILCVDTERHKYGLQQFSYIEELEESIFLRLDYVYRQQLAWLLKPYSRFLNEHYVHLYRYSC